MYFGSRGQKVVHFPSDNSDLLSSHFSVQSEVHYFWTASARILVYSQKQSILRACRVCRSHLSELSQPLIFCFGTLPVQRYCNQSSYPYYGQQRVSTTNQPIFTGFVACCCFKLIRSHLLLPVPPATCQASHRRRGHPRRLAPAYSHGNQPRSTAARLPLHTTKPSLSA